MSAPVDPDRACRTDVRSVVAHHNGCTHVALLADYRLRLYTSSEIRDAVDALVEARALTREKRGRHILLRATTAPAESEAHRGR